MRPVYQYLLALLIASLLLLTFAFFVLVPKAAMLSVPYKWRSVPIGQKAFLIHQYFGEPNMADVDADKWIVRKDNGDYSLTVSYDKDSAVTAYSIEFAYHLWFVRKHYLLLPE